MDPVATLLDRIADALPRTRVELRRLKIHVAGQTRQGLIPNDRLLARYRAEVAQGVRRPDRRLERILRLNGIRSQSGLATVTVITEPYACPGRCVYCPTETRAPKSYLVNEPAVMRALRNDYDPYRQVASRLQALEETGHPTDKIELIVKGGTWSFYPDEYQRTFIRRCLDAANACDSQTLEDAQARNEAAAHRIIGLTIETRPDYVNQPEIRRLRELGVTRVELGVQTLNDDILALIVRDHGTREIREATRLLRDAAFKVAYHLMPNLPGATPEDDLRSFRALFEDPAYRPDTLKLYPCVVVKTAELYRWWREGRYQPYDDETLVELLIAMKQEAPPYLRIERVIRDIPSTSIEAGCQATNLREEVQRRMRARGLACRCLRCRQVREETGGTYRLARQDYEASDGREVFLSFEDPAADRLAAFLRLRIPPARHEQPVLRGVALIRELHTYGPHLALHDHEEEAVQHRGFGRRLIAEAERIAREEFGRTRMAVIAGVGVREYYRRLGYELRDTYMVKAPV
ncbi:MAG: tRNA uridine(34) 5-carboxymethylaminomethyl modification radical SAM/GNAT enzyme Elp3 [Candidatus Omnitrophica bacterium]|nr:tRNA uridine(34) 5-carboxymethylaminomethyl modification radical SAM/GNAT enzyme Elp3 [Candidatus Omnitrophota bacterium]